MARNRGGGSSSSRPRAAQRAAPRAAAPAPKAAAPAQQHAPVQQHQQQYQPAVPQQGMGTGMMGMMANGMALGAGSGMGHMAVNSLFGGGSSSHQPEQQQQHLPPPPPPMQQDQQSMGVCQYPQQAQLNKCLQDTNYNASACQPYFDALKACQEAQQPSGF